MAGPMSTKRFKTAGDVALPRVGARRLRALRIRADIQRPGTGHPSRGALEPGEAVPALAVLEVRRASGATLRELGGGTLPHAFPSKGMAPPPGPPFAW